MAGRRTSALREGRKVLYARFIHANGRHELNEFAFRLSAFWLVERVIEDERTVCLTLSAPKVAPTFEWTIGEAGDHPAALRLLRDGMLVPLDSERLLEAERERAEAERERVDAEGARDAAHARIAELEAELRARA